MSLTDSELRFLRKKYKDAAHKGLIYAKRNSRGIISSGIFMNLLHKGFLRWSSISNFAEITDKGYAELGRPTITAPVVEAAKPKYDYHAKAEKKLVPVEVPDMSFIPSSWDMERPTKTEYRWE